PLAAILAYQVVLQYGRSESLRITAAGGSRAHDDGAASIRPQRIAADHCTNRPVRIFGLSASIRPQRIAADHMGNDRRHIAQGGASIRPQRIAADHRLRTTRGTSTSTTGFNKAAANRCGSPKQSCLTP